MKYFFFLVGISILFSFAAGVRSESSSHKAKTSDNKATAGYIDSVELFRLLDSHRPDANKVLARIDSENHQHFSSSEVKNELQYLDWNHENFCGDSTKEVILQFHYKSYSIDLIYVLVKEGKKYRISEPLQTGSDMAIYDDSPRIDFENRMVLEKSPTWGTCWGGSSWVGHRFTDGRFKVVLVFVNDHWHSTCGEITPEESWGIQSTYAFYNADSMLFNGILERELYENEEKDVADLKSRTLVPVALKYVYDHKRDTFVVENSKGVRLPENPMWAQAFWELHQKKQL